VRTRSRPYADELLRVSTASLKVELGPSRWRSAHSVRLDAEGHVIDARVVEMPCRTTKGGKRRFLVCGRCGKPCTVLGLVPAVGWCCRSCGGWRGRARTAVRAPAEMSNFEESGR
jgi:hypothetical protein